MGSGTRRQAHSTATGRRKTAQDTDSKSVETLDDRHAAHALVSLFNSRSNATTTTPLAQKAPSIPTFVNLKPASAPRPSGGSQLGTVKPVQRMTSMHTSTQAKAPRKAPVPVIDPQGGSDSDTVQDTIAIDDDDDIDDDDGDEEGPTYTILYDVPNASGATTALSLTNKTPFTVFLNEISRKMNVSVAHLANLAYVPSFFPRSPKPQPRLLDNEDAYTFMIQIVEDQIKKWLNRSKGKGAGSINAFTIRLFDMSPTVEASTSKTDKKTKNRTKSKNEDDGELAEGDAAALKIQNAIMKKHHCEKHKVPCFVLNTGEHHQYTMSEIAVWVALVEKHEATVTTPPEELKLGDVRQSRIKNHRQNPPDNMMPWGMPPQFFLPYPYHDSHHRHRRGSSSSKSRRGSDSSRTSRSQSRSPSPASTHKHPRSSSPPSIDLPDLDAWHQSLASSNKLDRTKLAEDLQYHLFQFHDQGFHTLSDVLLAEDAKTLAEITGITWPLAKRTLTIAAEDKAALIHAAKKQRK